MLELRDYQRAALDALYGYWDGGGGNGLIVLPTGCHARGTEILMYDGTAKPVELIAENDNLMGPDSEPRTVLRTIRGAEMMYRITPTKGQPFVVNENHILSLKTTNEGKKAIKYPNCTQRGGDVENISVRDYISKPKSWKHLRKLWRTGVEFRSPANDNIPVPGYVVGAMLGDGSLVGSVNITSMDCEVSDEVTAFASSCGVGLRVAQKPGNRSSQFYYPDPLARRGVQNRFVAALDRAGVWNMICEEKRIPSMYKTGSRHTRLEVLAGLMDTDGSLSNTFDFISLSQGLSEDVTFVARSLGLAAYIVPCKKKSQTGYEGQYWRVSISGNLDIIPTRLLRKQAAPRRQIKNPLVTGFKVEPVGLDEFFGFELDSDHLYLTSDFTVHHNSGKALVIAKLIEELLANYPTMRIINVTHSATLVGQNFKEFIGLNPFAPAGIYSAGLGRRDTNSQVLFAGIQSVFNKADELGAFDLIIVDEAHAISRNADTQYGKFFNAMKELDPDCRVAGTTATDYRMDSGSLTEGDDRLFDDVVYEIGIGELIEQGYLTQLTSQKTTAKIDLKGVGTSGGDYKPGQLGVAAEKIIEEAIAEDMVISAGRRAGLFFCASKENARHIAEAVTAAGRPCASLTSDNAHQTEEIFRQFREGELWGIASVGMITTGANFPWVDFISLILSTKSPGKLVQILGRGTRNCDGKTDCLVADHGKNLSYHGPIDQIKPRPPSSGEGEIPQKLCPDDRQDIEGKTGCGELLRISSMVCQCCGYIFPPSEEEKITAKADAAPVLSTEKPWYPVVGRTFAFHPAKSAEKPPTVKASYETDGRRVNEWLCPAHSGFPKSKADRFWSQHGGARPFPASVDEFLDRSEELAWTSEVQLDFSRNPKYPDVVAYRTGAAPANDNAPALANDNAANDNAAPAPATARKGNLSGLMPRTVVSNTAAADEQKRRDLAAFADDFIPF